MNATKPHFLLFSESNRKQPQGHWRFVLQSLDGREQYEAADEEPNVHGERLELLAVVRGLEALPEPARVTLVTPSRYVNRGLTQGLPAWRNNGWQWEHFGDMVPVKDRDLWQRIDRALGFHQVECRTWRFDLPHTRSAEVRSSADLGTAGAATAAASAPAAERHRQRRLRRFLLLCKRLAARSGENWRLRFARLGTRLVPLPWFE
jgi:ribonuclease HI